MCAGLATANSQAHTQLLNYSPTQRDGEEKKKEEEQESSWVR